MEGLLNQRLLPMLGAGMARSAGEDLRLAPIYQRLREQFAMGEIPELPDYNTWKTLYLKQGKPNEERQTR